MFCSNCGSIVNDQENFCPKCGNALKSIPIPPENKISNENKRKKYEFIFTKFIKNISFGYKITVTGALLSFISFFLPWIGYTKKEMVFQIKHQVSGLQMILGREEHLYPIGGSMTETGNFTHPIPALIILITIFIVFFFSYLHYRKNTLSTKDKLGIIIIGGAQVVLILSTIIIGIVIIHGIKSGLDTLAMGSMMEVSNYTIKYGLIFSLLGYLAITFGGVVNLFNIPRSVFIEKYSVFKNKFFPSAK